MIKRLFYKIDHGDRDASDPSSSSSDSEIEAEATEESEDDAIPDVKQDDDNASSMSSGYKSEDSSAKDVDVNSSGLLFSEDDAGTINDKQMLKNRELSSNHDFELLERKPKVLADENQALPADLSSYVLKCKSVFKCRICPRIICLNEDTLRDHLQSKRHARSEKLLSEGRLKAMLNSDGEIEDLEDSEIQVKDTEDSEEKNQKGVKQNKKRSKKKKRDNANTRKMRSSKGSAKKRQKNEN